MNRIKKTNYLIILILIFLLISISSCKNNFKKDSNKKEDKKIESIHKEFEKGPVKFTIDIDKKEITIADKLNLKLTLIYEEEYDIDLPKFGDKLETFGIKDYHTSQPELIDKNKTKLTKSYVLEPFLSGEYTIPPMKIIFYKKEDKDKKTHSIESESIKINVTSLLPENMKDLKIHEIMPPQAFPFPYKKILQLTLGIIIPLIIILIIYIWNKKKKKKKILEKPRPAHEIAYEMLEELVKQNLLEKDEIKLFYQGVSNILRRYIELRFSLKAPEQTTEEFLHDLNIRTDFPSEHKILLKTFLNHCDLVKFAEHKPTNDDIQNTFNSAKSFIEATKENEEEE